MRRAAFVVASQSIFVDPAMLAFRSGIAPATMSHAAFEYRRGRPAIEVGAHRPRAKIGILLKRVVDACRLIYIRPYILVGVRAGDAPEQDEG